jgi:cysteine desulfurase/selenocysteine lyase
MDPNGMLSLEEARDLFPGRTQSTYLSTCTRGLLPVPAREALEDHLAGLETGATDKAGLFELTESVRGSFASLVGCDSDEVAYTKNVSEGLNMIAASIDWRDGDNVVVCLDMEHPNNVYPWLNQRARHGIEVRAVAHRDGHVDPQRIVEAMNARTRLVTLPTVSFAPGFRTAIAEVAGACREYDALLLADGVQSVGILETDVKAMGIDALAVSTQKGLCGLYGMGFLYCRREWAQRLQPSYLARFGVDLGEGAHEAAMGADNYGLHPDTRRFDLGNYNYPGITVAGQSLKILNAVGTAQIEAHVLRLSARLVEGLLALGLPVAGGAPGPHSSSIVCVGKLDPRGHDSTQDEAIAALSQRFTDGGVMHSMRRGMLRMALHLYTDDADIDKVLELAVK